jgi:pimeloyl-ACP methyl ester carboxylesterase
MTGEQASGLVSTSRGCFNVADQGDPAGPVIVFVAGLGDDLQSWAPVLPYFRDYRCVTFDNRGCGATPASEGPYDIEGLAEDARAVVAALNIESFYLVGSSMGGAVVQEWLLRAPEDVLGAVITNSWARTDPYLAVLFQHWIDLAARGTAADVVRDLALFSFSPDFFAREAIDLTDTSWLNRSGFASGAHACLHHDALGRLESVETPTLVLAGRQDILTRPDHSSVLAAGLPRGELKTIDAGHMTFVEQPEPWAMLVREWLEGPDRPGRATVEAHA